MKNTLAKEFGITPEREAELKQIVLDAADIAEAMSESSTSSSMFTILSVVKENISDPNELAFICFDMGKVITEMNCPLHQMSARIGNIQGPFPIPSGMNPIEFLEELRLKELKKTRTRGDA